MSKKIDKPRMSGFEHAILSIADPEAAEKYEPYTYWEEAEMRQLNLKQKEDYLLTNMKHRTDASPSPNTTNP